MIVTLQTLAKFYFSVSKTNECFAIAEAAHYLPLDLQKDQKFMKVSNLLAAKQKAEIKAKQESRALEIKQLLDKLPQQKILGSSTFKDYLPSPLDTVKVISPDYILTNHRDCVKHYSQLLSSIAERGLVRKFEKMGDLLANYQNVLDYSTKET